MSIKFGTENDLSFTPVMNSFIDDLMPEAAPGFVVVYLYCLRLGNHQRALSFEEVGTALGMLESDVLRALRYWEQKGLLSLEGDSVTFFNVAKPQQRRPVILETRPQYSVQELELYKNQSNEISALFKKAEDELGRLLNLNDLNVIFGLYDWLRLPIPVIHRLFEYCAENNHRNMRYIERVAIDWAENGFSTVEEVERYILTYSSYHKILGAMGQSRSPSATEVKYMKKWLTEYNLPMDLILEACDRTLLQVGQPKLSYTDKILTAWHDGGAKTLEDVKSLDTSFTESQKETKKEAKKEKTSPKPKNRFINFNQSSYDYDKLEKMERELLEKQYNGGSDGV